MNRRGGVRKGAALSNCANLWPGRSYCRKKGKITVPSLLQSLCSIYIHTKISCPCLSLITELSARVCLVPWGELAMAVMLWRKSLEFIEYSPPTPITFIKQLCERMIENSSKIFFMLVIFFLCRYRVLIFIKWTPPSFRALLGGKKFVCNFDILRE